MTEKIPVTLSGVSELLLLTLYIRAMELQRPDALIKDEKAMALFSQLSYDFSRIRLLHLSEMNRPCGSSCVAGN